LNLERDGISSIGITPVNYKAKLLVTCYLIREIQNPIDLLRQKPYERAKTDSRAKFRKETIAGAQRRPK
jgi:hypothetical protein